MKIGEIITSLHLNIHFLPWRDSRVLYKPSGLVCHRDHLSEMLPPLGWSQAGIFLPVLAKCNALAQKLRERYLLWLKLVKRSCGTAFLICLYIRFNALQLHCPWAQGQPSCPEGAHLPVAVRVVPTPWCCRPSASLEINSDRSFYCEKPPTWSSSICASKSHPKSTSLCLPLFVLRLHSF